MELWIGIFRGDGFADILYLSRKVDIQIEQFGKLLDDAVNGSEESAQLLIVEYGKYLRPVVRRCLHERMRSQFDTVDFEQDVWASFFRNSPDSSMFATPNALIGFLRALAKNKVIDAMRQNFQCQKRDKRKEQAIDTLGLGAAEFQDRAQSTPSQALMSEEEWQFVLARQRPAYQEILIRFRNGQDVGTIISELGISATTVRRAVQRALALLTENLEN